MSNSAKAPSTHYCSGKWGEGIREIEPSCKGLKSVPLFLDASEAATSLRNQYSVVQPEQANRTEYHKYQYLDSWGLTSATLLLQGSKNCEIDQNE